GAPRRLHPSGRHRRRAAARHRLEHRRRLAHLFHVRRATPESAMKAALKASSRRMPLGSDRRRLAEIVPPEGVPLHFEVAGLGGRLAAQLIDIVITLGLAVAIVLLILLVRLG